MTQRHQHSGRFLKVAVEELSNAQRQRGDRWPAAARPVAACHAHSLQWELTASPAAGLVPVHFATIKGRQCCPMVKLWL